MCSATACVLRGSAHRCSADHLPRAQPQPLGAIHASIGINPTQPALPTPVLISSVPTAPGQIPYVERIPAGCQATSHNISCVGPNPCQTNLNAPLLQILGTCPSPVAPCKHQPPSANGEVPCLQCAEQCAAGRWPWQTQSSRVFPCSP
jgi:hypothetical protein